VTKNVCVYNNNHEYDKYAKNQFAGTSLSVCSSYGHEGYAKINMNMIDNKLTKKDNNNTKNDDKLTKKIMVQTLF